METKEFKGKAIYTSGGPAAEYGKYGCGFYVGCSNGCTYCYLKTKHPFKYACGGDIPTLKKHFKNEAHALEVFEKELVQNLHELQKHGLFFSFTTDPMSKETMWLTSQATMMCVINGVSVKILTKCAEFMNGMTDEYGSDCTFLANVKRYFPHSEQLLKKHIAFGFTLTGHDELEPNASTNAERIEAMRKLHKAGFKTWASIEPVIDLESSWQMILKTYKFCNLYKIGLESGKKYDKRRLIEFMSFVTSLNYGAPYPNGKFLKVYFKDSLLEQRGINRSELPSNCVSKDYSLFNV